jgi:hypothetical protein
MKIIQSVMALAVAALVVSAQPVMAEDDLLQPLRESIWAGKYREAVLQYAQLPERTRGLPEASYIAGLALFESALPDACKPYLESAKHYGYTGWGNGWKTTDQMLEQVRAYERLRPPRYKTFGDKKKGDLIRIYAKPLPVVEYIASAMPQFVARGRLIFGDDLPAVNIFIFDKFATFKAFEELVNQRPMKNTQLAGEGSENAAMVTIYDDEGVPNFWVGNPEGWHIVMHEYLHALCMAYSEDYTQNAPTWVVEGTADAASMPFADKTLRHASATLQDLSRQGKPPMTYKALCDYDQFHNNDMAYPLAALMMRALLENQRSDVLKDFLDAARKRGFEPALKATFGKSGLDVYNEVVRCYWK